MGVALTWEKFDIVPKSTYTFTLPRPYKSGKGSITFEERAENFTLIFRERDTKKVIYSGAFALAGPKDKNGNSQGVKEITFTLKMDESIFYEIEVVNHDSVIISGKINIELHRADPPSEDINK